MALGRRGRDMVFLYGDSRKECFLEDTTEIVGKQEWFFILPFFQLTSLFLCCYLSHILLYKKPRTGQGMSLYTSKVEAQQVNLCIGIWTYSWQIHQSRWKVAESRCISIKKKKNLSWHTDQYFSNVTNI